MTRFARADGSKGSNKREPEEATPWGLMVQQLQSRNGETEEFGVEDDVAYDDGEAAAAAVTAEEDKLVDKSDSEEDDDEGLGLDTSLLDEADEDIQNTDTGIKRPRSENKIELVTADEPKKKKRKKSEKCKICGVKGHMKRDCERLPEERRKELQELFTMQVERKGKGTGRKKKKKDNSLAAALASDTSVSIEEAKCESTCPIENKVVLPKISRNGDFGKGRKEKKDRSGAVVEKGEALFQGFRVKKEDQLRLNNLNKELKASGIAKPELEATLKKERRIAEKALARSKKIVCYQCREPGHMLADCPHPPAAASGDTVMPASAGHCFKCGSLEHTSRDCKSKLKRENAYRFAVCFYCKQEGHLAKECPDNPRGLYPRGGGCIFCGSVEHLKRDCPRKTEKDLRQGVRVSTIGHAGIEDEPVFDNVKNNKVKKMKVKKLNKVVAF